VSAPPYHRLCVCVCIAGVSESSTEPGRALTSQRCWQLWHAARTPAQPQPHLNPVMVLPVARPVQRCCTIAAAAADGVSPACAYVTACGRCRFVSCAVSTGRVHAAQRGVRLCLLMFKRAACMPAVDARLYAAVVLCCAVLCCAVTCLCVQKPLIDDSVTGH
jgi:hypothetical protein